MLSHKKCRQTAGQITVFLALCAGLVVTVIMAEIESARYSAVMSAQKTSAMLACSSMLAEYSIPLFEQYGIAEHFCEFYDVLHTQGGQWLVEEIDKMINERRK